MMNKNTLSSTYTAEYLIVRVDSHEERTWQDLDTVVVAVAVAVVDASSSFFLFFFVAR